MYQTHQRGSGLSATISEYMIRLKSQSSTTCSFPIFPRRLHKNCMNWSQT